MNTLLQLHLILTISGALSPNSSVGMYVLANENNTEYTTITLKTGGMSKYIQYRYISMHASYSVKF